MINASPFSMGLLTKRGAPDWHPAPEQLKNVCKKAVDFCSSKGEDIEKLAIQFAVSNPRIATTLFSTTRSSSVIQNLKWMNEPIDEELLIEVKY